QSGKPRDVLDGCMDASGRVLGTYIHGLFHNQELRRAILRYIARAKERPIDFTVSDRQRDDEYDRLAEVINRSLNMDLLYAITGLNTPCH
ncbi:cobyric acid synthase CobQ, partial [Chloroflexota bacterium]